MRALLQYIGELWGAGVHAFERGDLMEKIVSGIAALAALVVGAQANWHVAAWIGGLWFLAVFLIIAPYRLWRDHKEEIETIGLKRINKSERRRICEKLSVAMFKGRNLMSKCTNADLQGATNDSEVGTWLVETQEIVSRELGAVYFALFETPGSGPPTTVSNDDWNNRTWNGLNFRVNTLRGWVEELNKP